jgi:SAM-dependent methyltransferase
MNFSALASYIDRLRWSLHYRGAGMTLLACLANACALIRRDWYWKYKEHHFDRRHGLDTAGLIPIELLDLSDRDQARGWGYMPSQPEWFHTAISSLKLDYRRYNFIDFGSGKGRTLLLASKYPFRRIIGIEISRQLHEIAQRNMTVWRRNRKIPSRLYALQADAAQIALPDGPCVLYFYNPFKASVMEQVLAHIEASYRAAPRHMVLIYANPTSRHVVDRCKPFTQTACFDIGPPTVVYETKSILADADGGCCSKTDAPIDLCNGPRNLLF